MKLITKNSLLLILVVVLAFAPLYIARSSKFAGADSQASAAISTLNANYAPWFAPFWKPPSAEVESFLFALQAAIGSGFVFYYLGYAKGKHSASKSELVQLKLKIETSVGESTPTEAEYGVPLPLVEVGVLLN